MSDMNVERGGRSNRQSVLEEGAQEVGRMQKSEMRGNGPGTHAAMWLEPRHGAAPGGRGKSGLTVDPAWCA